MRLRWDWARRNPANASGEPPYLGRPRRPDGHRGLPAAAGPREHPRARGRGRLAGRSAGRGRAAAAGARRGAAARVGSRSRRRARRRRCRTARATCSTKLRWPKPAAAVPGEAAEPPRAAPAELAGRPINRLVSAVTLPFVRVVARARPLREEVEVVRRFDATSIGCGSGWRRSSTSRCAATRAYLNWKYAEPPHVRYTVAVLRRDDECTATPSIGICASRRAASRRSSTSWPIRPTSAAEDAAALGRPRGARRGLGQDPLLRAARGVPPRAAPIGIFRREVERRS